MAEHSHGSSSEGPPSRAETRIRPGRAALLALLFAVLGLGSALFPGRVLLPEDPRIYAPLGAAEASDFDAEALTEAKHDAVPSRRDAILQFLPFDTSVAESWRRGEAPLWETRFLCGAPMLAQATSRAFYPTAILSAIVGPGKSRVWSWLLHLALGGFFAYLLARRFGASEGGGLLANASLVLSGYAWGHVQHPMIFNAAVWLLPALFCVDLVFQKRHGERRTALLAIAGLAFCVALSWLAGFAQASVVLVYAVTCFALLLAITRTRHERRVPASALALTALGIACGLGLAAPQILPTLELASHSARLPYDLELQRSNALTLAHLLELVLPGQLAAPGDLVVGGTPRPTWLALLALPESALEPLAKSVFNHTETAFAFGIWPLLFACLAIASVFSRGASFRTARATLTALALFGLLVALAVPGIVHLVQYLPGLAIGDVKRLLVLPGLLLPILAGIGFQRPRTPLALTALIVGTVLVAAGLALFAAKQDSLASRLIAALAWRRGYSPEVVGSAFAPGELGANQILLARGALLAGLALLLGGALGRLRRGATLVFLGVTALELIPVAWSTTPAPAAAALDTRLPAAMERAAERQDGTRIAPRILRLEKGGGSLSEISLWPPNLPLRSDWADVFGYAPISPQRFEAFVSRIEPEAVSGGAGVGRLRKVASLEHPLLELFAADFLLTNFEDEDLPPSVRASWQPVTQVRDARLWRRKQSAQRVRLYHDFEITTPERAVERVGASSFDPGATLVLEGDDTDPPLVGRASFGDRIDVVNWQSGRIDLSYEVASPAIALIAEGWMPGWTATITRGDGVLLRKETRPAQVAFQAVSIPGGKGRIALRYAPPVFRYGLLASAVAALVMLVLLLLGATRQRVSS